MRTTAAKTLQSDINVTPLVDVCLVLLIIFMVVTALMVNGVPVHLPPSSTSGSVSRETLQVTINADRTLYVGTSVIRADQLEGELRRLRASSDRPVIVRGEKSLAYGDVVSVLDACRSAGFSEVSLATVKH